ncbi:MAG: metallophosphoesterase family protein [Caldilineaceae bacterium]|nr:metallophosphoesterase family protein [Caldilineaceae bacterium]
MVRIAVLADIHGNWPALQAVQAELSKLEPDFVVLNGDLINAVPFSPDVLDAVRRTDWLVVRGNHEFYYLNWGTDRAVPGSEDPKRWGQLHWLVDRITPEQGAFLATLPDDRSFYLPGTQPLRITHGVPGRNRVGFYNEQSAEKIANEIADVPQHTLVSAHTHVQIDRHIRRDTDFTADLQSDPHANHHQPAAPQQWHLINPGSVGLPLNGDPQAQFAILESVDEQVEPGGWRVHHQRIPYDRRPALAAFAETGMLEAGGVISQLFYWELATAEPEIIYFYRWANLNGHDPDNFPYDTLAAYVGATGRDAYVRSLDPMVNGAP